MVTSYGADPTGRNDSTVAIRKAITAAEATSGNTVFFPSGTYLLDDNDGANVDFKLAGPNPVNIEGAGRDTTKIIEKIGKVTHPSLRSGKDVFHIVALGGGGAVGAGGDHSTISGLTIDSQTFQAGTTIIDFANNTTISHIRALGARSNKNFNNNVFDVRVIAVCTHTNGIHRINNTVDDLILNGQGSGGNTDLDISCQWDAKVSNVVDTGNGMDLYIVRRVTVDGFNYTPGTIELDPKSYFITGPSDHISLNNVVSSGNGGYFQTSPNNRRITDTTITNEKMTNPTAQLGINDADNTTISNSNIATIKLAPTFGTHGLTITASSVGSILIQPKPKAVITDLIVTSSTVGAVLCQPTSGATISSLIGVKCAG